MSADSSEALFSPPPVFYAVVLHNDGTFVTEEFDTVDALVVRLRALIDQDVSVSCFHGIRLHVSKPPMRYLMTPTDNHELFELPSAPEPDDSGYLGVDPIHMGDPPQLKLPQTARGQQNAQDDFFDDGNENVMGVFDSVLPDPDS